MAPVDGACGRDDADHALGYYDYFKIGVGAIAPGKQEGSPSAEAVNVPTAWSVGHPSVNVFASSPSTFNLDTFGLRPQILGSILNRIRRLSELRPGPARPLCELRD
jgi:hypothetical protein